jgi:hypothetical protein
MAKQAALGLEAQKQLAKGNLTDEDKTYWENQLALAEAYADKVY